MYCAHFNRVFILKPYHEIFVTSISFYTTIWRGRHDKKPLVKIPYILWNLIQVVLAVSKSLHLQVHQRTVILDIFDNILVT